MLRFDGGLEGVAVSDEESYVAIAHRFGFPKSVVEAEDADFVENLLAVIRAEGIVQRRPKPGD